MAVELFRLRTGRRKGGVSTGDVRYFEDRADFEEALLNACLSKTASESGGSRRSWLSSQRWLEALG